MTRSLRRRYSSALGRAKGVPSLSKSGRRPWKRCRAWKPAVTNSPAYGARNVSRVAAGTGEALPGPAACGLLLPERGVLTIQAETPEQVAILHLRPPPHTPPQQPLKPLRISTRQHRHVSIHAAETSRNLPEPSDRPKPSALDPAQLAALGVLAAIIVVALLGVWHRHALSRSRSRADTPGRARIGE